MKCAQYIDVYNIQREITLTCGIKLPANVWERRRQVVPGEATLVYTGQAVLCQWFAVLFCDGAFLAKLPRRCFSLFQPFLESPRNFPRWISQRDGQASEDKVWNKYRNIHSLRVISSLNRILCCVSAMNICCLLIYLFYCFFALQWAIFQSYIWL